MTSRRIISRHSSGEWDKTGTHAFEANIKRMRSGPCTLVSRTEATASAFNGRVNTPHDHWGLWHPRTGVGWDCSVEWDNREWALVDHDVLPLTDIRITTAKGHLQEPVALTWALLDNRHNGARLLFGATHLDLANTALRRRANLLECAELRRFLTAHRDVRRLVELDGNRNQRVRAERDYFARRLLDGTGCRSAWRPLPLRGGTHGPRSVLDLAVTDLDARSSLMTDDKSSDHRPIETRANLPAAA